MGALRPPFATSYVARGLVAEAAPLSMLLVLPPSVSSFWNPVLARAAMTVQVAHERDFEPHQAVTAAIEYAVLVAGVQTILLGDEGPGGAFSLRHARLDARFSAVLACVRSLPSAAPQALQLETLYYDTAARQSWTLHSLTLPPKR